MMLPQLPRLSDDWRMSVATYVAGSIATITLILFLKRSSSPNLDKIPTVGATTWLGSWRSGVQFLIDATDVFQEGYDRYKGTPFKVSGFFRWMVVISGRQHVEEFCKRRDDELNFVEALEDILKAEHTFGLETHRDPYHIAILRSKLNRNLVALYDDIRDEIASSFEDLLKLEGREWKSVPALHTIEDVVCRTSNRVLVGLPLCRDPDWVRLNVQFPFAVFKAAAIITLFPRFMETPVAWAVEYITGTLKRAVNHMIPVVEARRKLAASSAEQPNDTLSWLLEGSEGSRRTATDLTRRVLAINFAAIHTTSQVFTQALYSLAANPEYVPLLREEVESIVNEEGWSKAAMAKMHKVDSFMKEILRMHGVTLTNVMRKCVKDVTFSDGTVIPKGTFVVLATQHIHNDDEFYENATTFDPMRFAKLREGEEGEGLDVLKYQFSSTNTEYLPFGHGRHACPGRFFAASELTTMLAHVVYTYDIKLEDSIRPPNMKISTVIIPNPTARVMFRKRTV